MKASAGAPQQLRGKATSAKKERKRRIEAAMKRNLHALVFVLAAVSASGETEAAGAISRRDDDRFLLAIRDLQAVRPSVAMIGDKVGDSPKLFSVNRPASGYPKLNLPNH